MNRFVAGLVACALVVLAVDARAEDSDAGVSDAELDARDSLRRAKESAVMGRVADAQEEATEAMRRAKTANDEALYAEAVAVREDAKRRMAKVTFIVPDDVTDVRVYLDGERIPSETSSGTFEVQGGIHAVVAYGERSGEYVEYQATFLVRERELFVVAVPLAAPVAWRELEKPIGHIPLQCLGVPDVVACMHSPPPVARTSSARAGCHACSVSMNAPAPSWALAIFPLAAIARRITRKTRRNR